MPSTLHFSVSQLKTYLRCPQQYWHRYVIGTEPAFLPLPLAFGTAFHEALAHYYSSKKERGETPTPAELRACFSEGWKRITSGPVPLSSTDDGADPVQTAGAMLDVFHGHASTDTATVVSVEHPFEVDLHDPRSGELLEERLVGTFDAVLSEGSRNVIAEHKSSKRRYSDEQLRCDLQPTAYTFAANLMGLGDVKVRMQIVTKARNPAIQVADLQRGPRDEDDFLLAVTGVLRAIDSGAFYPVRSWQCDTCPYAHVCTSSSP